MTLLAPISALVAAALTVPALLIFYFLKLKRLPVRVSSTMLFEDAAHDVQVNVPFKWIRPSWLLLLQLIALALLLLALGRPAVEMFAPPSARLVLLIDRSASMNAIDPDDPARTTRLDRARARAHELVRRGTSRGSRIMIVSFAGSARAVSAFTSDSRRLHAAIDGIMPTDGTGDIAAALALVDAARAGMGGGVDDGAADGASETIGQSMDVILLSDGMFDLTEPLSLPGASVRFESMAAPPVEPSSNTSPGMRPDTRNIAIDAFSASRDPSEPAVVRAFVRLVSTKKQAVSVTLTLSLDGEVVRRRVVEVPAIDADGQPGEAAITERLTATRGALLTASIDVGNDEDALSADNTAAVVLPPATRPRVLLVEPGGAGRGGDSAFLVQDVLDELALAEVRLVSADQAEAMRRNGQLGQFSLIVYDRVAPLIAPPVPSLSFGAPIPIAGMAAVPAHQSTRVLSWRRTDALMRDVSLDALVIAESIALTLDSDIEATVLARGSDGPLIVRLSDGGITRVVVAFDLRQSTWPLSPSFAIFLSNAVDTLATIDGGGGGGEGRSFTTAQPATVIAPATWRTIVVRGPRSFTIDRETQAFSRTAVPLGVLELAGVYYVSIDGDQAPPVAVNLQNRTESMLVVRSEVTIGGETLSSRIGTDEPREIWHWFVLGSLFVLACEWAVNAAMMRV